MASKTASTIELTKMLHNLSTNECWEFFYDETNNFRKLKVRDTDFNNKLETHFVLGGILDDGNLPTDELLTDSQVVAKNDEIKFKNFAKGEFLACLKSRNLRLLLKSFNKHSISIHYSSTNALYWAIVDIVDGALDPQHIPLQHLLKAILYLAAKAEQEALHDIFVEYDFPAVEEAKLVEFYSAIQALLTLYIANQGSNMHPALLRHTQTLQQLLKTKIKSNSFSSQLEITKGLLFKNDGMLYARNIAIFQNSEHIFDNEDNLQEGFEKKVSAFSDTTLCNYKFVDSKSSKEVQLSDIIVGIIARLYDFLDRHTPDTLQGCLDAIFKDKYQRETLCSLAQLINRSIELNQALIHSISPLSTQDNMRILLDYCESD
ncbi:DUF3800 domain-containing protein [Verrucomicrobiaceae bacterium 227]